MELKVVKQKCPLAYNEFSFWRSSEVLNTRRQFVVVRDLYTFFDKKKIIIEVCPEYNFGDEYVYTNKWYYTINNGTKFINQSSDNKPYPTRVECEIAAFYAAFYALEDTINRKKK